MLTYDVCNGGFGLFLFCIGCVYKESLYAKGNIVFSFSPLCHLGLMQLHGREFLRRTYFFIQYKEIHNNR